MESCTLSCIPILFLSCDFTMNRRFKLLMNNAMYIIFIIYYYYIGKYIRTNTYNIYMMNLTPVQFADATSTLRPHSHNNRFLKLVIIHSVYAGILRDGCKKVNENNN